METIRYHKPKSKIKELNSQNIQDILYLLQPALYTDISHQADFYGYGIGNLIKAKQEAYISVLSSNIIKYKTKNEIQQVFNILNNDINYFPGWVKQDKLKKGQKEFWESEFGKNLLIKWKWMISKFVNHINNMMEVH